MQKISSQKIAGREGTRLIFQEKTYSVLLVSAAGKFSSSLLELLPSTDYYPITTVSSISEAKRRVHESAYDLVLINAPLPDDFGLQFAIDTCAGSNAAVLLLVKNELYNDVYSKTLNYGVMLLSKPTSAPVITQSLRFLCATRERLRRFEAKHATVEEKIEEIKLVNHAKWLLIEAREMTEEEAHRFLEKTAMDQGITKRAAAQRIISEYEKKTDL